jgi:hypothetical protein
MTAPRFALRQLVFAAAVVALSAAGACDLNPQPLPPASFDAPGNGARGGDATSADVPEGADAGEGEASDAGAGDGSESPTVDGGGDGGNENDAASDAPSDAGEDG